MRFATLISRSIPWGIAIIVTFASWFVYCIARSFSESFGFDLLVFGLLTAVTMIAISPLVLVISLSAVVFGSPLIYIHDVLPIQRWQRHECPKCGYSRRGVRDKRCPECGTLHRQPASALSPTSRFKRTVLVPSILSALLGCVCAEGWIVYDEGRFRDEVSRHTAAGFTTRYGRARAWPNTNGSLVFVPGRGIHATQ